MLIVGISAGIGIGYLAFDPDMRSFFNKKYRKSAKMIKRQTADARESAKLLLEKGEKELKHAADMGRRVYREVAG
jgi:hypothetical protein